MSKKNIDDGLSLDGKTFLMNLIKKNAVQIGKSGSNNLNKKRSRKNVTITLSRSDLNLSSNSDSSDDEFNAHELSSDDDSSHTENVEGIQRMKRIKRNANDQSNGNQSFTTIIRDALTDMSQKLNILSKNTAELDTVLSLHRESPSISLQSVYSSSDPVPSYVGNDDHTISDEILSVTVPAKNVAEVNDLNKILEDNTVQHKIPY